MLWPESSAAELADLGSYLTPPTTAAVECFAVSKPGEFMVVASKRILALFRLKPVAPLYIHPSLFPTTEIVDVAVSAKGEFVAVHTADNRVSVFVVQPRADIEESLRMTTIVTPGEGEAIGARELWLQPLQSVCPEYKISKLASCGSLLLLFSSGYVHISEWDCFTENDPLKPITFTPHELPNTESGAESGVYLAGLLGGEEWITISSKTPRQLLVTRWTQSAAPTVAKIGEYVLELSGDVTCVDYNERLEKLAVGTKAGAEVFHNLFDNSPSFEMPNLQATNIKVLQWTAAGTALFVGFKEGGWQLLSMLGLNLYYASTHAWGVRRCEFLLGGESAVLLCSDGAVRTQNMLRWSGFAGVDRRPVLHGNGRLLLYHSLSQPASANFSQNGDGHSWLTVPLPTWYMAQNWPLAHVCGSSDGRHVAIAGKVGIMLFSVATKQWKEIGDRECMVRGGLCWYGRRLVAGTFNPFNGTSALRMYSPVEGTHQQSASGAQFLTDQPRARSRAVSGAQGKPNGAGVGPTTGSGAGGSGNLGASASGLVSSSNSHQVEAEDVLGRAEMPMVTNLAMGPASLLAVVVSGEQLLLYSLSGGEFEHLQLIPLRKVLASHFQSSKMVVRSVAVVSEVEVYVLVNVTLVNVKVVKNTQYEVKVVADPIESFEYLHEERQLWVFDGQEAVVTDTSASRRCVASVQLDAYPVHFSAKAGTVSLVESEPVRSFDGRFSTARPFFTHEVYIHYLLEAALMPAFDTAVLVAKKYEQLPYFAGVLESLLYHTVTSDSAEGEIERTWELISRFESQNAFGIVAACARKVETTYWPQLFAAVGEQPADIFDRCLKNDDLETAAEYLIVVQATEKSDLQFDPRGRILELYRRAAQLDQMWICRQVCEFIMAVDPSGDALRTFRDELRRPLVESK